MELRLALREPATGARADVLVRTRDGACLDEVAGDLLARVLPAGGSGRLTCQGRAVPGETLLGAAPLVQGAMLEVDGELPAAQVDWQVCVVGGRGAGRLHPLPPGGAVVGREGPVRLDDALVSRQHCRLDIELGGVRVRDLGSANGTRVDGVDTGADGTLLTPESLLTVGRTRLAVRPVEASRPLRPTGDGRLAVDRPPQVQTPSVRTSVHVPEPPREGERGTLPVLSVLAPVVLGVVMWQVTGSTTFLLLTLLSPVMVLGAHVTERRSGRRRSRRERREWAQARTVAEQRLAGAVRADELDRRDRWPDLATVVATAAGPGPRLWSRGRTGLDLRLGVADQPADVDADGDTTGLRTTAHDVPVVVALDEIGVLGVAGSPALLRALVLQAAVLHGPGDLQLVVLSTGRPDWLRELPHLIPTAGQDCTALLGLTRAQAAARIAELSGRSERDGRVLLVVDGARELRTVPGLAALLADGPARQVLAVCADIALHRLPPECRATVEVDGDVLRLRTSEQHELLGTPDLLPLDVAESAARALAALRDDRRDRDGARDLPAGVRWVDEVGLDLDGDAAGDLAGQVAHRWGRCTTALLGRSADGPVVVDLVRDGPHALVAGTTGSGKSELLQTLVASLALGNRPDELALVLVDYKGGAAFGPCTRLPHVVGMVTDLDGALVERALASLGAELSRREAVLRDAGVKDLSDLLLSGGAMPRLVLVVDEFASLVEELPDLVTGLVGIAMRGRSLGVHLVLATQRPEGVVSADIRANTNLRICLAVTRETESRDVLDAPDAASISRRTPGRGYLRRGPSDLHAFQAARVGGRRPGATGSAPVVELVPTEDLGEPVAPPTHVEPADTVTDLDLLVDACAKAAVLQQVPSAPSPWLPPLPETVPLPAPVPVQGPGLVRALAYGVLDVPAEQARRPLLLDLDTATHLLVVGAARSGRTTVLRSLAGAVATAASADEVHLHALDGGGALGGLCALPHTGAVVPVEDADRVDRLLRRLLAEVARRAALLNAEGHGSLTEQRTAAAGDDRLPHLLLLVDRWEAFVATYADLDAGRHVDAVHRLLREGPAVGLHVVMTCDRTALVGRTASLIEDRLLLRMADATDYAAAGLSPRLVPDELAAGRGWSMATAPLVAQVSLLDPDPSGPAQAAALRRLGASVAAARRPAFRLADLPAVAHRRELPVGALGVGGDDVAPLLLPDTDGLVIGGPPGSGRSTALLAVAAARPDLRVLAVAPRPSPLRELDCCGGDPGALQAQLAVRPWLLLLDDAELLVDSSWAAVLEEAVRTARDGGSLVAAAGGTAQLQAAYRGAVVELRRARTGVLLSPQGPEDGDLLGLRLSRSTGGPVHPGRGLLVQGGRAVPLQVALP